MTDDEKTFLLSVKSGQPNWSVMGIEGIEKLSVMQGKLANIRKMSVKKRAELLARRKRTLCV